MNRLSTIVIGTDFSACAGSALAQAIRMSQWNQAALHVLHVIDGFVIREVAEATQQWVEDVGRLAARRAQEQWREHAAGVDGAESLVLEVAVGVPVDELLKKVRGVSADLLVLGTTGETGSRGGAGMLATKCLRKSPSKVMLTQCEHGRPFQTVVACVDFSEHSRQAVEQARRVAAQDGSRVHFLHVFTGPWRRLHYLAPTPGSSPDFHKQYLATLQGRLREFVGVSEGNIETHFKLYEALDYGHGIATYARHVGADLVVLGSRGRSNLGYVLLGSTVERLLREVPCSVLTIRV